ncbi:GNAT family N-acetyltransferase [Enterovibrio sp. ZSDZ35]|uniref:GNAT family N-acetyltransferase n=1 Tax=Enterovibrio qingdaonensis TaxID=2899818 RepID=A0ABT5QTX0_9GAMM|nr:GNAT family N-acetyltransferase [Enterovibrio sp. ZSDZ35]MDD1784423.1 GNAT family N-acetyltransferase [Enterovibrio sp. ZSDZ35]
MPDFRFAPLNPLRFPIVTRFYKSHYPAGKPKKDEVIWTAEGETGLCGAVRFKQFDTFQLLTGMLISPSFRGRKLGVRFLEAVDGQTQSTPCYCLAYRYLTPLYETAGFRVIGKSQLPAELQGRYSSYCNSGKDLIPMLHFPIASR